MDSFESVSQNHFTCFDKPVQSEPLTLSLSKGVFSICATGSFIFFIPYRICFRTSSVIYDVFKEIFILRAVDRIVRTHCWQEVMTSSAPVA